MSRLPTAAAVWVRRRFRACWAVVQMRGRYLQPDRGRVRLLLQRDRFRRRLYNRHPGANGRTFGGAAFPNRSRPGHGVHRQKRSPPATRGQRDRGALPLVQFDQRRQGARRDTVGASAERRARDSGLLGRSRWTNQEVRNQV